MGSGLNLFGSGMEAVADFLVKTVMNLWVSSYRFSRTTHCYMVVFLCHISRLCFLINAHENLYVRLVCVF
jgi:hypothetical protein